MANPIALCIEDLAARSDVNRYLRCVALVGAQDGLGLTADGAVVFQTPGPPTVRLCVSADDQLALFQPTKNNAQVVVERAGRQLVAPEAKPVILLDGDQLHVGRRHLRIHVHGRAARVHPPMPLSDRSAPTRTLAVAVAAGAVAAGCSGQGPAKPKHGSNTTVPTVRVDSTTAGGATTSQPAGQAGAGGSAEAGSSVGGQGGNPRIEIREIPPVVVIDDLP